MLGNAVYKLMRVGIKIYLRCKYNIRVHNECNLPPRDAFKKKGFIVACNHQSYSDPPVIAGVISGRFAFMAKKELFQKSKPFAWLITACGAFPVDRGARDSSAIERSVKELKKGRVFVIFPEGTRSKDGTIGRAKSGVALIAGSAGVPVLPMCIVYGADGDKRTVDVSVGKMIPAEEIAIVSDGELPDRAELKRVSERILDSIKELQKRILRSYGFSVYDIQRIAENYKNMKNEKNNKKEVKREINKETTKESRG